ncbi:Short-chain dehydrogenase/reductase SDR [Nitrosococcus oceani ATCC 19707]|uniref:Short-chain dehydrogenase/reductase SDR n=2 Tax=Nitrosococcus oceani TaxID=1229 RepID=Q3J9T4_NITOC|nr:SDR family oxidoreductase [Nitrosococcus oceani]ABA58412.1 Short-chain dehydrogenase/reductase SDR [Nitrosococcus oceani ATCC 19707]EDZ66799.1 KR domain superfamily [Nitrosococcus oceani AFC27]KFI19126.1 short-chain dehydrogenase [Nitrosococcus oceani C-27]GEM18806.1 short-chain dehydrogenase [Nitrosococcus oceani]
MRGPVLVLGATSAIARGTAAALARRGHSLYLGGKDESELARIAADLNIRYQVEVRYGAVDATDYAAHRRFLERVIETMGGLEGVVWAIGYLGDSIFAQTHFEETEKIIAVNFTGAVSLLGECAAYLEGKGAGFIIGLSSVAGDRGRQSNYYYGAAKGGLSLFLQGLRNRLFPAGVRVLTIKPGFVDTAMTFGLPGLFLLASPASVGERIVAALERSRDVIYVPWFWFYIMFVIRMIPEPLFKRLKL